MTTEHHFHYIVPVWGQEYTSLFTDVCLPMLLTPGNLATPDHTPESRVVILTTWQDHLRIEIAPSYARLKSFINVEFLLIDGLVDTTFPHAAMSQCYDMAIRHKDVVKHQTAFVFLTPDSFWPDGTFRELKQLAAKGFKVVMAGGLRVNSEPMSNFLKQHIAGHQDNPSLSTPDIMRAALANIHQLSTAFNLLARSGFLNIWPSHMYWIKEQTNQFLAHCFHLHPLMVMSSTHAAIGNTIDGDFLENLSYSIKKYHVLQEDYLAIELTPSSRDWGQPLSPPSLPSIIWFSLLHANSRHWHFFGKRIAVNGSPATPMDPLLTSLADETVRRIQRYRLLATVIQTLHIKGLLASIGHRLGKRLPRILRRLFGR